MGKKKRTEALIVILAVVVLMLVIGVFAGYEWRGNGSVVANPNSTVSNLDAGTAVAPADLTRQAVPANVTVPSKSSTGTPANVAVPTVQGPGNPSGSVSYRSFNITIKNGAYSPNTVIVKQGDTVNLVLTAVGANYAFTQPDYGFNAQIPEGGTKVVQFEAVQSGEFTFYCGSCGGPSKGPVGHIIVTPG